MTGSEVLTKITFEKNGETVIVEYTPEGFNTWHGQSMGVHTPTATGFLTLAEDGEPVLNLHPSDNSGNWSERLIKMLHSYPVPTLPPHV